MKRRILPYFVIFFLFTTVGGCRKPADPPARVESADTVAISIGKETFHLEIADSEDEHRRGLMYRDSMAQDHGMIFVFDAAAERQFWMHDTLLPLDILYLDATGRIVSIKSMKPRDDTPVPSDGPARYAIELNQGSAARAAINPGDVLTLPAAVLSLKGSK